MYAYMNLLIGYMDKNCTLPPIPRLDSYRKLGYRLRKAEVFHLPFSMLNSPCKILIVFSNIRLQ